jgi:nucleotide-binding universal stress UspA family protein
MDSQANEKFEGWCIVELMGHNVIAGYVTEQVMGGAAMLRVDVPAIPDETRQAFTKFFAPSAIYGITPTSEEHARTAAERIRARPIDLWIVPNPKPQLVARVADPEQEEIDAEAADNHDWDDDDDDDNPF